MKWTLAATAAHSGDWLQAPPIASVGRKLSEEAIRLAVAHELGCRACEPHTCACDEDVDARGLHGSACRKTASRQQRHRHMNDVLWRTIESSQLPAVKEPVRLVRQDGKRPDGATPLPWARGKPYRRGISLSLSTLSPTYTTLRADKAAAKMSPAVTFSSKSH